MDRFIIAGPCSKDQLACMIAQWKNWFNEHFDFFDGDFDVAKIEEDFYLLKTESYMNDTMFFMLVEYLSRYQDSASDFEANGFMTGGLAYLQIAKKKVRVFSRPDDLREDNVWLTTEDQETYRFTFDRRLVGKECTEACRFYWSDIDVSQLVFERIETAQTVSEEEAREIQTKKRKAVAFKQFMKRYPYLAFQMLGTIIWFVSAVIIIAIVIILVLLNK